MQPIRADIHTAVDYGKDPEEMTLRDTVEYYKKVVRVANSLGTPTTMETRYVDEAWTHLMKAVAGREGIPTGWLSYMVGELARSETKALELSTQTLETIAAETSG